MYQDICSVLSWYRFSPFRTSSCFPMMVSEILFLLSSFTHPSHYWQFLIALPSPSLISSDPFGWSSFIPSFTHWLLLFLFTKHRISHTAFVTVSLKCFHSSSTLSIPFPSTFRYRIFVSPPTRLFNPLTVITSLLFPASPFFSFTLSPSLNSLLWVPHNNDYPHTTIKTPYFEFKSHICIPIM